MIRRKFSRKNLQDMGKLPIFASFKLTGDRKSQVSQPAIFVSASYYDNNTTATASGARNVPGVQLVRLEQRVVRSLFYVLISQVMNQTIQIGRVRPSVLSRLGRIVKNCRVSAATWLQARSNTFSVLCGEEFTRGEVIISHLAFVAGLLLMLVSVAVLNIAMKGGAL